MNVARHLAVITALLLVTVTSIDGEYQPTWDSLDTRPLPSWYDEAKFGIFIHWGVFSVPSYGNEWFWYYWQHGASKYVNLMNKNYPPGFTYPEFAPMFTAEFFNPNEWADLFSAAGAKYVVMTTKHHEGFTMWGSPVSWNWNAVDVGPHRDLVGSLASSIRNRTDLHFGVYHSLFEWFNPIFIADGKAGLATQNFVREKTMPELYELVNTYHPEVIWSDGDSGLSYNYWNSTEFIAWLYNESPVNQTVVVNDRWGLEVSCKHGDFYTCTDRYNPGVLQKHKWENCMTIDSQSWGYRREATLSDYLTIEQLISQLVSTVSCNGNLLLNVGPTHEGTIIPVFEERLRQIGAWLKVNGEAIYSSKPWAYQNDTITSNVWYTSKMASNNTLSVYAMVLFWPDNNVLHLGAPRAGSQFTVSLLGYDQSLKFESSTTGVTITFPSLTPSQLPCQWAWTLKLEGLSNEYSDSRN